MTKRTTALIALFMLVSSLTFTKNQASASEKVQVQLNQALVIEGGESTNPRNYDPATTLSAGDKLVFSGLVSFDPNLNLITDLAERWDVNAERTVYTFHLRENAKFHDGRTVTSQDV